MSNEAAPKVLIVDDEPRNLALLEAILSTMLIDPTLVANGVDAIAAFERETFDLVLLDVMMPGLDGLATLARLRALTPPGEHVPIVLVTALDARADRLRGLDAGADDFLTKPVDAHEVRCRVRTFLNLRATQVALKRRAEELERVQRAKAELAAMIVHDLKNPLAAIAGNVKWIAGRFKANDTARDAVAEALADVSISTDRLVGLVSTLIDVEKAESGHLQITRAPVDLSAVLDGLAREHGKEADERNITLTAVAEPSLTASVDAVLVTRALENLLLNALRYAGSRGRIGLEARVVGEQLELSVANTGRAIPEDQRATLFQKYATTERKARGDNLGLGLYFCRLVAEGHGGTIEADSTSDWATRFVLRIPRT
jgi:two-component system sensor histidine kinase/response regulator